MSMNHLLQRRQSRVGVMMPTFDSTAPPMSHHRRASVEPISRVSFSFAADPHSGSPSEIGFPSVWKTEVHFVYPFTYPLDRAPTKSTPNRTKEPHFGDDGHLLFHECLKSIPILPSRQVAKANGSIRVGSPHDLLDDRDGSFSPLFLDGAPLATLKDKHGNIFKLEQACIRLLTFGVGLLRFAVSTNSPLDIQHVLDAQNSIMRLTDPQTAGRMSTLAADGSVQGVFEPADFIANVLSRFLGPKDVAYFADQATDRLSVYTLAAIEGCVLKDLAIAAYKIGQMEWSATTPVDEAILEDFRMNQCYQRFANSSGGIWMLYHSDGGATLYFGDQRGAPDLPLFKDARAQQAAEEVCGTTRPQSSFSMLEAILFHRTFLRGLDDKTSQLIARSESMSTYKSYAQLQAIHAGLLKFRSFFMGSPVSSSSSSKQQFGLWTQITGIDGLQGQLSSDINDLHTFFGEQSQHAAQQRLDTLAVVLGFLGIASLVTDIFTNYIINLDENGQRRKNLLYVPGTVSLVLLLVAILFIWYTRV